MMLLPAFATVPEINQIYNCKAEHLLSALPDNYIDLIVTSPPYDSLRKYSGNWSFDFQHIARQSYRVLKPGGVLVWVVGDATINGSETLTSMRQALYFVDSVGFRMHDTMIWEKTARFPDDRRYYQSWEFMFVLSKGAPVASNLQTKPNKQYGRKVNGTDRNTDGTTRVNSCYGQDIKQDGIMPNVWFIDAGYMRTTKDDFAFEHPAMFPEALAERHILTWSNPGDIVLDYFTGSGTTAKMARANNRRYLGCDISPEYVALAQRRLAQPYTPNMFETLGATA